MSNNACKVFTTTTPSDYPIEEAFGYTTNDQNFPGLLGLSFQPESSIAGYTINGQASLAVLSFPNLVTISAGPLSAQNNTALTSVAASKLATVGNGNSVTIVGNPLLTSLVLSSLANTGPINISTNVTLPSISLPSLVQFTTVSQGLTAVGNTALSSISLPVYVGRVGSTATINFSGSGSLTSFSAPNFVECGVLNGSGCTQLASLSLPALTTVRQSGGLNFSGCTALVTVSLPVYLPTNARPQNFGSCALSQASVDHILARCVANSAYVVGTITLNGGTSAAPGTQGQTDKATLITRGCTVLTN